MTNENGIWGWLERWRSVAFLVPGSCFLLIGVNYGTRVTANTGMDVPPWIVQLLMLLVFAGLLGLSPRLYGLAPKLTRLGQVLALFIGAEIVIPIGVALATPISLPQSLYAVIIVIFMIGSALTVTIFGIACLRTGAYSRPVGGFLLLAVAGVSTAIVSRVLFGDPGPEVINIVVNGIFGTSMIGVGYVLRSEDGPTKPAEATETVA
jgi:hypothetical protein